MFSRKLFDTNQGIPIRFFRYSIYNGKKVIAPPFGEYTGPDSRKKLTSLPTVCTTSTFRSIDHV